MAEDAAVSLRAIAPSVFLPSLLYGIGRGAISPVIAISALHLGASVGVASLVVALLGVGQVLADLPAGALATRVGERRAMLLASVVLALALVVCALARSLWQFSLGIGLTGAGGSVWLLARQAYLTDAVPAHMRARALSTLGGVQRIGAFIGPFLGAVAVSWGGTSGAYWVHLVAAVGSVILLTSLPDVGGTTRETAAAEPTRMRAIARRHARTFGTLGIGAMMVGVVRQARLAVIPLWGAHLGLDTTTTALIFGASSAVDMLLFYPAGKIMDHFGRVWVAVPSLIMITIGLGMTPFTTSALALSAAAALMGLGNGTSSGLVMTLGADASPPVGRSAFLGVWRLCSDAGTTGGPVLLGLVSSMVGLASGIWSVSGLGLVGAAAMYRWVPRRRYRKLDEEQPVAVKLRPPSAAN